MHSELLQHRFGGAVTNIAKNQGIGYVVSKEDYDFLQSMKVRGIRSEEQFEEVFSGITRGVNMLVAEQTVKYQVKKKGRRR